MVARIAVFRLIENANNPKDLRKHLKKSHRYEHSEGVTQKYSFANTSLRLLKLSYSERQMYSYYYRNTKRNVFCAVKYIQMCVNVCYTQTFTVTKINSQRVNS